MSQSILLIENMTASESSIITESVNDGKNLFLSGIFMQAEVKNRNGRIYPINEMTNAVNNINTRIKEYGGVAGELDHPSDRLNINLNCVSHVITELYMNGNNVCGKMKILDTPYGNIAKSIIKSGLRIGVSSRGTGMVNESTNMVSNFNLNTIDIVATPSAMSAYPDSIYESLNDTSQGRKIVTLAEALQHDEKAQKFLDNEIRKFIKSLTER